MQLKSFANTKSALQEISALINDTTLNHPGQEAALTAIGKKYTTETLKAALAQSTLNETQMEAILLGNGLQGSIQKTTAEELFNAASTHAVAEEQKKAAASTLGLSTAFKGLWLKIKSAAASLKTFLTTSPLGPLTIVAGTLAAVAFAIKKYNDHLEEMKQKTREAAAEAKEAVDSIRSDFDSLSSTTDKIKSRYAELAQGVENLGKANQSRGTLSTDEYSEFLSLSSQLAELFPQLTTGYDENGNAILSLSGNINTIVGSLNDLVDAQQRVARQQILDEMPDIWAGYTLDAEEYKKDLADAQNMTDSVTEAISQLNGSRIISYDIISNGKLQRENENLNEFIREYAREAGFGNAGNDWNGLFQPSSEFSNHNSDQVDAQNITWDFSSLTEEQFYLLQTKLGALSSEYEYAVMLARNKIESANADLSSYLNTWLSEDPFYAKMDPQLRNAARSMLFDVDWLDILPDDIDPENWDDVSAWIQENFLYAVSRVHKDPQIAKALSEVYTNAGLTPPERAGYLEQLLGYFGEDSLLTTILQPRLKEAEELQDRYQDAISRFGEASQDQLVGLFQRRSINSSEEIDYWNQVTAGAQNATEAIKLYLKSLTPSVDPADPSQIVDQLDTRLRPVLESLGSAYRSIFSDGGFDRDAVDIPMLDSLRASIEELNSLQDVDINIDMDAFDAFVSTLTTAGVTQEQGQRAFDAFATSLFYATDATEGMTEETRELVEQLLQSLGVTNAAEVAEYALLEARAQSVLAACDLAGASRDSFVSILAEGQAAGLTRQQIYGLTAAEIAYGQNGLNAGEKLRQLKELASAYGDTASAALATALANDLASGHTDIDSAVNDLMARMNAGIQRVDIDFSGLEEQAARAGSAAGRSYADALRDELSDLNSVISYIGSVIDQQIDLFNDQKDAAIDALEAEKEAAQEALEAEKALVREKIDARQAEIDRIREASSARKEEISLQKAQYDLERMQGQKAILQYSHDRGMHYAADTDGLRQAREAYTEARENILVSGMEKEISGLEDAVDGLDKKIEESNRHYDSLIQQTEEYWDSLIEGLETYKSHWQELSGLEERAKMEAALRDLGITREELLDLSGSVLGSFRDHYLGVLQELHANNDGVLEMLQQFGGVSADALRPLAGSLSGIAEGIRDASAAITGGREQPTEVSPLTDSITLLGETTGDTLGGPEGEGVTGRFGQLSQTIADAGSHVAEVISGITDLDGMTADCTITVHIETTGEIPDAASGTGIADAISSATQPGKGHSTPSGNSTPPKNSPPQRAAPAGVLPPRRPKDAPASPAAGASEKLAGPW